MTALQKKLPLSVSIISFNEEKNIANTLSSVADIASEIVVVDSHSTDRTRAIARQFGASVHINDWLGHVRQKNRALQKCTQNWILALDCDEVLTEPLKQSIINAVQKDAYDGFHVNRRSFYLGRRLKYAWQPDWKLRLVKRACNPRWRGYDPHDVLEVEGRSSRLEGDLNHLSYKDIGDHYTRLVKYARITAHSYQQKGRQFRLSKLVFNPGFAFLKKYLLQRGCLDGLPGFAVAVSSYIYVFLKYLYLWDLERGADNDGASTKTSVSGGDQAPIGNRLI
jgi:glycosyltransferase involved in cell wall biosynthesis